MSDAGDLFPETIGQAPDLPTWEGQLRGKWDHALVTVRLLTQWDSAAGWTCGWFVSVGQAVDEWHPEAPDAWRRHGASYPWYRPDGGMTQSRERNVAIGQAARHARMVIAQMEGYAEPAVAADARAVSDAIERQARQWLTE